jgi:hypothetical protein
MAEQLKKEEKVRNMVGKELPKLREKLRAAVEEYEATVGLQLKVEGVRILATLDAEDADAGAQALLVQKCGTCLLVQNYKY